MVTLLSQKMETKETTYDQMEDEHDMDDDTRNIFEKIWMTGDDLLKYIGSLTEKDAMDMVKNLGKRKEIELKRCVCNGPRFAHKEVCKDGVEKIKDETAVYIEEAIKGTPEFKKMVEKYGAVKMVNDPEKIGRFPCDLCDEKFNTPKDLGKHMNGVYRILTCEQCNLYFNDKKELKEHEKNIHGRTYPCKDCGKMV